MTKSRDIASAIPAPSTISSAELGYLDGVTSAIQTQIDGKQAVNANVSTTELGYLDGVTSAVQTQLDAKTAKATLTTTGDIYYASSASTPARLGIGSSAQVLTVASGLPSWATPAGATTSYSLITSASNPTGTNTVTLSGLSGYNSLVFFYRGIIINATSGQIRVQFNSDTASNYDYFYYTNFGSNNSGSNGTTTSFTSQYTSVANNEMSGYMQIQGANGTGKKLVMFPNFSYNHLQMHTGVWNNTAAISSINLTSVGGNFNGSSGTFQVYGSVV